ncbi:hypothetical protein BDZ94DRAFT_1243782 [Collybia nuda]|uniref:Uncharacterized protein n=1 Tax=Collybia nuda TaxID=64659 RepID=A0A9P6CQZ5_9AGAR|nr:hypothetical protein BDZ94DRAFT_1243782 [Collybia nuda]
MPPNTFANEDDPTPAALPGLLPIPSPPSIFTFPWPTPPTPTPAPGGYPKLGTCGLVPALELFPFPVTSFLFSLGNLRLNATGAPRALTAASYDVRSSSPCIVAPTPPCSPPPPRPPRGGGIANCILPAALFPCTLLINRSGSAMGVFELGNDATRGLLPDPDPPPPPCMPPSPPTPPPPVPGVRFIYIFHHSASIASLAGTGSVLLLCPLAPFPPPPPPPPPPLPPLLECGIGVIFGSSLSPPTPPPLVEKNGAPSDESPASTFGSSSDINPKVSEKPPSPSEGYPVRR